ncbi:DNA-binding protein [Pyrobaculum sp. 3827-6]|uniref:DNA-binding protein n=1 Tax=Pyrobaculum sp. 3827-6 TaxID=2983604 RepID=UPI0021D81910|nr:DNA-binding protein [Pyrobaculum sp. 3827-6]MCU7787828.1 DNA-binding protein [Pyrobaculum sp. 3827-6]
MSTNAIADASFLIDWARYGKRDLLFDVFEVVWVSEPVLAELHSEGTVMWVSENMARGRIALFPELPNYREEALRLMELSGRYPVRRLDYPEAYCIAVAGDRGFVVLSENGAAYASQHLYARARVWRALEVLGELARRGLVGRDDFLIYERETRHKFPRRDLERIWRYLPGT